MSTETRFSGISRDSVYTWAERFKNEALRPRNEEDDESHASSIVIFGLTHFQSALYSTVVEDSLAQITMLCECNSELRIIKTRNDRAALLARKYGVARPAHCDALDGVDPANLGAMEYKLNKLYNDRNLLMETFKKLYLDLTLKKSYQSLCDKVEERVYLEKYRANLEIEEPRNRIYRYETAKELRKQRNYIKMILYDLDSVIDQLGRAVEDASLYAAIQRRYVWGWQRGRSEQHWQVIAALEGGPLRSLEEYKVGSDHEQRVHAEIELFTNIKTNETLEEVERWMEKYDKDTEAIDLKVQIQKNSYQSKLNERIALENTFENHARLIKDWLEFKAERERQRVYRETMHRSATVVQAWWRGILVRRELGPYKPKKKPKKQK